MCIYTHTLHFLWLIFQLHTVSLSHQVQQFLWAICNGITEMPNLNKQQCPPVCLGFCTVSSACQNGFALPSKFTGSSGDSLRKAPPNHDESTHKPLVLSAAQSPATEIPRPSKMFNPPAISLTAQNCPFQLPTALTTSWTSWLNILLFSWYVPAIMAMQCCHILQLLLLNSTKHYGQQVLKFILIYM